MRNPTSAVQTSLNECYANECLMYLIQILTKHIKHRICETNQLLLSYELIH